MFPCCLGCDKSAFIIFMKNLGADYRPIGRQVNSYSSPWKMHHGYFLRHYDDVIMSVIASQITSLTIVYSTVYPGADQSKHQSSASLAFVWGIHRGPVNSPHKWPVTRKMFPFDDVIMWWENATWIIHMIHQSSRTCSLAWYWYYS